MVSKRLERGTLGELNKLAASCTVVMDAMGERRWLDAVEIADGLEQLVDDLLRSLVVCAREDGGTWAEIGDRLGVTRQGAWDRFGGEG